MKDGQKQGQKSVVVPVLLEAGLTLGLTQEDPRHLVFQLVMQKRSVCASRILGASRKDRRVKKERCVRQTIDIIYYVPYGQTIDTGQTELGVKRKSEIGAGG